VAAIFCYIVFLVKNSFQREDIKKEIVALQTVGTIQQKEDEKTVINYQKKISDFADLLNNHEFASNAFAFMEAETMPNIWFKQFSLDEKNAGIQLSGEADSMDALSRQVAVFEKNKYVINIATLNSSLGDSARVAFNINLSLSQDIFSYIANAMQVLEVTTPTEQPVAQDNQTQDNQPVPEDVIVPEEQTITDEQQNPQDQAQSPTKSSENLITVFHLLLKPEVIGLVNQTSHTITLRVPFGTDVKNLTPSMVISPEATVSPDSSIPQNFENPVTYTIIAQDGSVQSYEASVIINPPPEVIENTNQAGNIWIIIIIAVIVILVIIAVLIFVWKKFKGPKHNF